MGKLRLGLAAAAIAVMGVAAADQISIPNQFTAGTPARAAEVNENFNALAAESNAQDMRLSALESGGATEVEQLICRGGDWPRSPLTTGQCLQANSPTPTGTVELQLDEILLSRWRVKSVGGDPAIFIFEREVP